jgi:hypothetical protein
LMNEFMMPIAFDEIPVSGCTCKPHHTNLSDTHIHTQPTSQQFQTAYTHNTTHRDTPPNFKLQSMDPYLGIAP